MEIWYFSYTMVQNTSANVGESAQTANAVNDWADIVIPFDNQPLFAWIRTTCAKWDAAEARVIYCYYQVPIDFKSTTTLLAPSVHNTGDSGDVFMGKDRSCCYALITDTNVGWEVALSNDYIPVYDEYKGLFFSCDKFQSANPWEVFPVSSERHQSGGMEAYLELSLHFNHYQRV